MKYTVRSPDGELTFHSFREMEKAYWDGLVDPDDEVQEEGASLWRKAGSFAVLRGPGPQTAQAKQKETMLVVVEVLLATVALGALFSKGHDVTRYGIAILAIAGFLMVLNRIVGASASRRQTTRRSPPTGKQ